MMKGINMIIDETQRLAITVIRTGKHPLNSVQLIYDLSLFSSIFCIPSVIESTFSASPAPHQTSVIAASILDSIIHPASHSESSPVVPRSSHLSIPDVHPLLLSSTNTSPSPIPRLFLASALTPYRDITYTDAKQKQHLAVEAAIREGLKLGVQNHYLDGIPALFTSANLLRDAISQWHTGGLTDRSERVAIGRFRI